MARRRCRDCLQRSPPRPSLGEGRGSLQNRVACVTRSKLEGKLGGALGFVGRPSRNHPDHRLAPSEGDAKPSPQRPAAQGERREAVLGERGGGGTAPSRRTAGHLRGGVTDLRGLRNAQAPHNLVSDILRQAELFSPGAESGSPSLPGSAGFRNHRRPEVDGGEAWGSDTHPGLREGKAGAKARATENAEEPKGRRAEEGTKGRGAAGEDTPCPRIGRPSCLS